MPEKLVRDRIPEIITETGGEPIHRRATSAEIPKLLLAKLREEMTELGDALDDGEIEDVVDELADVSEVLLSIGVRKRPASIIVQKHMKEKRREKGGFRDGVVLVTEEIRS